MITPKRTPEAASVPEHLGPTPVRYEAPRDTRSTCRTPLLTPAVHGQPATAHPLTQEGAHHE
jgi:hypothetical protein